MNKKREGLMGVQQIRPGLVCIQSQWNLVRRSREQVFHSTKHENTGNSTKFQSQFNTFKFTTFPAFGTTQTSTGTSTKSHTFGGYGFGGIPLGPIRLFGLAAPSPSTEPFPSTSSSGLEVKPALQIQGQLATPDNLIKPVKSPSAETSGNASNLWQTSDNANKPVIPETESVERKRAKISNPSVTCASLPEGQTGSGPASIQTTNLFGQQTPSTPTPSTSTQQQQNPATKKPLPGPTPAMQIPFNFGFDHGVSQQNPRSSYDTDPSFTKYYIEYNGNVEDQLDVEKYCADFTINEYYYVLKLTFMMFKKKLSATLTLTQIEPTRKRTMEQANSTAKIKKEMDEGYAGGDLDIDQKYRPTCVWANVNLGSKHSHVFKRSSNYDRRWVTEKFDGSFLGNNEEPFMCFLFIEFPNLNDGERNALKLLTDLYVHQTQCDVQFSLEDNQKVGGHVNILSTKSPVFAALFEQEKKSEQLICVIQDMKPNIFNEMLHYIYSGRTRTALTQEKAQSLYLAAEKYEIEDLKEECVRCLLAFVRVENVINLMTWAHLNSVEKLKEKALSYMANYSKEICKLDDWEKLIKYYPDLCLLASRRMMG